MVANEVKRLAMQCAVGVCILLCACSTSAGRGASLPSPSPAVRVTDLDRRMDLFLSAFDSVSAEDFIEFFPRRGEVVYRHTRHSPQSLEVTVKRFRADEVAEALRYSGALWASFQFQFEGQPVGLLPSHVMARPGKWHRIAETRFVPPGADSISLTYVQWRMEDQRWVISEFGDETFVDVPLPEWMHMPSGRVE